MKRTAFLIVISVLLVAFYGVALAEEAEKAAPAESAPAQEMQAEAAPSASFTVDRMVITDGVENLEPMGEVSSFPASTAKAYVFLEAKDIAEDTPVSFVWYYKGEQVAKVDLTLRAGSRWRTYSSKNITGFIGDWKVELQDANGNVLKEAAFAVQ